MIQQLIKEAKWVWNKDSIENDYVQFREEFFIEKDIIKAKLLIGADTEYSVWINGKYIASGQYQDFSPIKRIDNIDIVNFLQKGKNCICIMVHYQGESSFQYIKGIPGLIYEMNLDGIYISSGEKTYCRQDKSYKTGNYTRITPMLGYCYHKEARYDDNWLSCDYEISSDWEYAIINEECSFNFQMRPIKKLEIKAPTPKKLITQGLFKRVSEKKDTIAEYMQTDYLSYRNKEEIFFDDEITLKNHKDCDGIYLIYDLGREEVGYFTLEIEAQKGTVIDISYGEHLEDMRVRAYICNRYFANRYIANEGKNKFTHYFTRIAGRYLQIHISNFEDNTKIHYIGVLPTEYPVEKIGEIDLNDNLHNQIYDVAVRTLELCMHNHYEDCPWREQGLYAMDSRNQALFGYYCFGNYKFAIESFRLLAKGIRKDGHLRLVPLGEFEITIPVFSMIWIVGIYEYILYSGDTSVAEEFATTIETILEVFLKDMQNGLAALRKEKEFWHFYDWAEGLAGTLSKALPDPDRLDAPYQLFLCMALQKAIKIFEICKKPTKRYEQKLDEIQKAFNEAFYDEEKKLYCTYISKGKKEHYCELVQTLALCTDVCPKDKQEYIRSVVASENSELIKVTLSHSIFKIDALMQESEKYGSLVMDYIAKNWGYMLKNGATSFWETLNGASDFGNAGSLCHGWSAVPIYFYFAYIAGIKPTKPGFKEYTCMPLKGFDVKAKINTLNGCVDVN